MRRIPWYTKETYNWDDILQKRPIILSILQTVATPYHLHVWVAQNESCQLHVCVAFCDMTRMSRNTCIYTSNSVIRLECVYYNDSLWFISCASGMTHSAIWLIRSHIIMTHSESYHDDSFWFISHANDMTHIQSNHTWYASFWAISLTHMSHVATWIQCGSEWILADQSKYIAKRSFHVATSLMHARDMTPWVFESSHTTRAIRGATCTRVRGDTTNSIHTTKIYTEHQHTVRCGLKFAAAHTNTYAKSSSWVITF